MFDFLVSKGVVNRQRPKCMLRYDGIDILKNSVQANKLPSLLQEMSAYILDVTGFRLKITEKPYKESLLKEEIERQLCFDNHIPEQAKAELEARELTNLKYYPTQKHYFEMFVAKIMLTPILLGFKEVK